MNGLSLFSNVGMAETYLKDLGINIVIANELVEERARFYKNLYSETDVICGDITDEKVFDEVISKSCSRNVEFLIATPPCQGMSCAGRKDPKDPRNFLISYAVKAALAIKPKFIIFENVPMQQHTQIFYKDKYVFIPSYVESELSPFYEINTKRIVNSKEFGVPQSRSRYIYLMARKDLGIHWEFEEPKCKVMTLNEAIGSLPSLDPLLREKEEMWRFPQYEEKLRAAAKVSKWHFPPTHSWKQVEWMLHTPTGKSAFQNEIFYPKINGRRIKGAPRTYMRMSWGKPATTVMQNSGVISAFSTVHPGRCINDSENEAERLYSDPRALSIYELLIVSSLPTNWNIPEWAGETLIRKVIGEGIPPKIIKSAVESLIRTCCYGNTKN